MQIPEELITKYNVPAPRYTSYPTVPMWENNIFDHQEWMSTVRRTFNESNDRQGISLYIHLPYCESLCTYCACNVRVTKNHSVEAGYIDSVLQEWELYCEAFEKKPLIKEIHLGGGTPTFFSPEQLKRLIEGILAKATVHEKHSFSLEGHPNNTTREHLEALYEVGFRRVSYGVQDINEKVQKTINRIQPYENVLQATAMARSVGYTSVNFDLIYGLPFQTEESIIETIQKVVELKPERIAFYSYAHVPWKRPGQRSYTEAHLPDNATKRKLYERGKEILQEHTYTDIGMDHFALAGDDLYEAYSTKTLHRNFMGYTVAQTDLLIGLGASAISDARYAYAQNPRDVEAYQQNVAKGITADGQHHVLTTEDQAIRELIMDIACSGEVRSSQYQQLLDFNMNIELLTMAEEGLIQLYDTGLRVTALGMPFLRNICMVFDKRLRTGAEGEMFSKAI